MRKPALKRFSVTMEGVDEIKGFDDAVDVEIDFEMEDHGIGNYEFWGARGTQTLWTPVPQAARVNGKEIDLDDVPASVVERATERAAEESQEPDGDDSPPDNED